MVDYIIEIDHKPDEMEEGDDMFYFNAIENDPAVPVSTAPPAGYGKIPGETDTVIEMNFTNSEGTYHIRFVVV